MVIDPSTLQNAVGDVLEEFEWRSTADPCLIITFVIWQVFKWYLKINNFSSRLNVALKLDYKLLIVNYLTNKTWIHGIKLCFDFHIQVAIFLKTECTCQIQTNSPICFIMFRFVQAECSLLYALFLNYIPHEITF